MTNTTNNNSHARNQKNSNRRTCANCPASTKASCTAICKEMEAYLEANGATISHNSPVNCLEHRDELNHEGGSTNRTNNFMKHRSNFVDPERILLNRETDQRVNAELLQFIASFCEDHATGLQQKSIMETALVLHYLEDQDTMRIGDILGERFPQFKMRTTSRRNRANGKVYTTQRREDITVRRILAKFQEYVRTSVLRDKLRRVMETGTLGPIQSITIGS